MSDKGSNEIDSSAFPKTTVKRSKKQMKEQRLSTNSLKKAKSKRRLGSQDFSSSLGLSTSGDDNNQKQYINIAKSPDILPPAVQISFPPPAKFNNLDVPSNPFHEIKELPLIEQLDKKIEKAQSYIPFFYRYRSLTKALNHEPLDLINQASNESSPNKETIRDLFTTLFIPTCDRILEFVAFSSAIPDEIFKIITDVVSIGFPPSDVFYMRFSELLKTLFIIDNLKMTKPGINNDFSFFKRNKNGEYVSSHMQELQVATPILATPLFSINQLHNSIIADKNKNVGIRDFFSGYMSYLVESYKSHFKTNSDNVLKLSDLKQTIITSMVCVCYIYGNDKPTKGKDAKENMFNMPIMNEVYQILSDNPIIPLYGEGSYEPLAAIKKAPGFPKTLPKNIPEKLFDGDVSALATEAYENRYLASKRIKNFRDIYHKYLPYSSEFGRYAETDSIEGIPLKDSDIEDQLIGLLSVLSQMTGCINEQFAYKLKVIAAPPRDADGQEIKVGTYNRGVKFNYTEEDLNTLVELIGYIKTISGTLLTSEGIITDFATKFVYTEVQNFLHNVLKKPLETAQKENDKEAQDILLKIQTIFSDPLAVDITNKKTNNIKVGHACISKNQLDHLRSIIHSLKNGKLAQKSGAFKKPILRQENIEEFDKFLKASEKFYVLLNYSEEIRNATNLGCLWFREIYMDMENVMQYPVRSSLPFILLEHLLNGRDNSALHDAVLYPFEIYNDAASMALNVFQSQYLYKEVEAEIALCVDMISFNFADTFYKFSRLRAAIMELPIQNFNNIPIIPSRYGIIIHQNKVQLLGSHIDFNKITTLKLNDRFKKELETYTNLLSDFRLESYVAHLVRVARRTFDLLKDQHLSMDDFDSIWQRAIKFSNPLTLDSQLVQTINKSLDFSHYLFTSLTRRFTVTKEIKFVPLSTDKWASEYAAIHELDTRYIGRHHFKGMAELLSPGEMSSLFSYLEGTLQDNMSKMIECYTSVAAQIRLLPSQDRDKLSDYFNYSHDAYQSINHKTLGSLYNYLRVIGNLLAFVVEIQRYVFMGPCACTKATGNVSFLAMLMEIMKHQIMDNKELFYKENPVEGFEMDTLKHRSFTSIWTLLEFIFCTPESIQWSDKIDSFPLEAFGEGPVVAAHTIITLCDQCPLYKFDSIVYRSLQLYAVEGSKTIKHTDPIYRYIEQAKVIESVRRYVSLFAEPFKIQINK